MNDMKDSDSNILARIDERTQAHTTAFALHVKEDSDRFDKVFQFCSTRFDKIDARFDKLDEKLQPLQNESNRRKGAFSASKLLVHGAWAVAVLAASWVMNNKGV